MALTDLTRISTAGIATGTSLSGAILHGDAHFRGTQVGITSALFDSSDNALEFNDNVKLTFGNSGNLQLYYDGSSYITNGTAGHLLIKTLNSGSDIRLESNDDIFLMTAAGSRNSIVCRDYAQVELYHNNQKKFETAETGAVVTGILTATTFSGNLVSGGSGISTFYDLRVTNNLTVEGTTTTLDTNLIGVDRVEVGADSNTIVGVAVTQSGTADLVNLFDGATKVVTIDDTGQVGLGSATPAQKLDVVGNMKISGNIDANGDLDVDGITTFNLTNHPEPLKIISNNTGGNISTYLFTANSGYHDIKFEHNYGGNWNYHDHMRLIWSAPNESNTYTTGELFSIQPKSGVPGFTRVEYKINDSSSGLVNSYNQAYDYHQWWIKNSVVFQINTAGIAVTNRIVHYGYSNDFIQFGHHNMQFHIGSDTDRRLTIQSNRIRFQNLADGVDIDSDLDVDGHTELDNVNISGVTTTTRLDISSTTPIIDLIETDGKPDYRIYAEGGELVIREQNPSVSNRLVIDSGGVNIPNNLFVSGISTFSGVVRVPNGSAAAPAIHFGDSDSGVYGDSSNGVRLTAGGSDTIVATTNGVTFPPSVAALTSLTVGSQSALSKPLYFADAAGVQSASILLDNSSQELRIKNGRFSGQITFTTYNTEKVRIDSSGRLLVGIHTSSTNYGWSSRARFATETTGDASSIHLGNSTNPGIVMLRRGGSTSWHHHAAKIYTDHRPAIHFETAYATAVGNHSFQHHMTMKHNAGVGIGTVDPKLNLHIHQNNSNASFAHFTNSITGVDANQGLSVGLDSDENAVIYHYGSKNIRFATNNTQHMMLRSTGQLGIGTALNHSADSKKLTVVCNSVGDGIHIANKENLYPAASTGYSDLRYSFYDYTTGGYTRGGEAIIRALSRNAFQNLRTTDLLFLLSGDDGDPASGDAQERLRITSDGYLKLSGRNVQESADGDKLLRVYQPSRTDSEQDVLLLQSYNTSSANKINIGGGDSSFNSATQISLRTADINVLSGYEALRISNKGNMTAATGSFRSREEIKVDTLHMPQAHEGYSNIASNSGLSVAANMFHQSHVRGTSHLTTELFSTRMGHNAGIFVYVEVWFSCAIANYQGYQALWANAHRTGSNNFTINNTGQEGNKLGTDTGGYFDLTYASSGSAGNQRLTWKVVTSFGHNYVRCLYKSTVVGHDYFVNFTTIR